MIHKDFLPEDWAAMALPLGVTGSVLVQSQESAADTEWPVGLAEAFGAGRLIWGSDWPVLELAGTYADWLALARSIIPEAAHALVFEGNARGIYRL